MGDDRLEGLLLLEMHKSIHVDATSVVKKVPQEEGDPRRRPQKVRREVARRTVTDRAAGLSGSAC